MVLKLNVKRLAVICGIVNRLIASTIPTMRSVDTMVIAIKIIIKYSIVLTGNRCERAKMVSNAMLTIVLYKSPKTTIATSVSDAKTKRSVVPIVRIFPNKNEGKSGINPGVKKQQIMPTLIPRVQNMAMAESSLMCPFVESHCTPHALIIEKIIADIMGLIPRNTPIPIPPNDACVIPPLINTRRRVTM